MQNPVKKLFRRSLSFLRWGIIIGLLCYISSCGNNLSSMSGHDSSELNTIFQDGYQLFLTPVDLDFVGKVPPSHLRYRQNVPASETDTYYEFRLCLYENQEVLDYSCINPFYGEEGPLVVNLYTLKTIKNPLEKIGVFLDQMLFMLFDIADLVVDHTAASLLVSGLSAAGLYQGYKLHRWMSLWSYKEMHTFARSAEFKALGLNRFQWHNQPGKLLFAMLRSGVWQQNPKLVAAAMRIASQKIAKSGVKVFGRFSQATVYLTALSLVIYSILPEKYQTKVRSTLAIQAGTLKNMSNEVLGPLVELGDNDGENDLARFAISWNENTIFDESLKREKLLPMSGVRMIPEIGRFLADLTRPYILDIKGYCLPVKSKTFPNALSLGAPETLMFPKDCFEL
ncbi:MAG: hypothetical protein OXC40_06070 [Proteobacteria bacterium]|nr:hypothetical protein [Pseudomonadota bacterium]